MSMNLPGLAGRPQGQRQARPGRPGRGRPQGRLDHLPGRRAGDGFGGTLLAAPGANPGAHSSSSAGSLRSSRRLRDPQRQGRRGAVSRFRSGRSFVFAAMTAAPTSLATTLSGFDSRGRPVAVRLPASVRVGAGATVKVTPANWRSLASTRIRIRTTVRWADDEPETPREADRERFATVARLAGQARRRAARRRAEASSAAPPKQGGSPSRGRSCAAATPSSAPARCRSRRRDAQREGLCSSFAKALRRGRYRLRVRALETTAEGGGVQGSETAERTLGLHLR